MVRMTPWADPEDAAIADLTVISLDGRPAPSGFPRRSEAPVLHQGRRDAVHDAAGGYLPDQAARRASQHAALRSRAGPHLAHARRPRRAGIRRAPPHAVR